MSCVRGCNASTYEVRGTPYRTPSGMQVCITTYCSSCNQPIAARIEVA